MSTKNPPKNPLARTIGRILPDTCVDFGEVYLTSGENTMSDKASWRVVITLVVLFCAGVGIWYKNHYDTREAIRKQHSYLKYRNEHSFTDDLDRAEHSQLSYDEVTRKRELRERELERFENDNSPYLRD